MASSVGTPRPSAAACRLKTESRPKARPDKATSRKPVLWPFASDTEGLQRGVDLLSQGVVFLGHAARVMGGELDADIAPTQ